MTTIQLEKGDETNEEFDRIADSIISDVVNMRRRIGEIHRIENLIRYSDSLEIELKVVKMDPKKDDEPYEYD